MLDYIFSGVIALVEELLSFVVDWFLGAFNFTKDQFDTVFPFAKISFNLIQSFSLIVVLFIGGICVIKILRGGDRSLETPVSIFFRACLAVAGIYLGNYILEGIIDITMIGYNAIWETNLSAGWPEANGMSMVISAISSVFYNQSILLYLFLLGMIGYQLILVLLEAVERFLILYVLLYLSPLAFSTLASAQTSQSFQKFCSMFISQCILMILNIWAVKMALSVFASIGTIGHNDTLVIPLVFAVAFLKIAQRFDLTLNKLGMNAALTGAGLGQDLLQSFGRMGRTFGDGMFSLMGRNGNGPVGGAGGVMGMAQKVAGMYGKYSPFASAYQNAANQAEAAASTILGAVKYGADAKEAGGSFWQSAKDFYEGNIGEAAADAANKSQSENVWTNMEAAPEGFSSATEAMATAVMDRSTQFSDEGLHLLQDRADVASAVMRKFQGNAGKITDNDRNAAMLHSLQVPESENFVRAAYGSLEDAKNVSTVTDRDGMRFAYETPAKNGSQMHSMEVKNHAQYSALSTQQRTAFKEFTAPDGTKKYYRIGSDPTPTTPASSADPASTTTPPPSGPVIPDKTGPGREDPSTLIYGAVQAQGIPEADYGDYASKEVEEGRKMAYSYHSGTDFSGSVTPAAAGEILDGYANGGVPQFGFVELEGSDYADPQDAADYSRTGGETTITRHVNTQPSPARSMDSDVERIYAIAKAAVPTSVPRYEIVRSAKQSAEGIRLQTDTGAWELRPESYIRKLPESKRKEYTEEYTSPQGNHYYTRFRPRWTTDSRKAYKSRNEKNDLN